MKKTFLYITFIFLAVRALSQFPTGIPGVQGGFGNFGALGNIGTGGGGNTNFTAPENWIPDSVPLRITRFVESDLNFYNNEIVDTLVHNFELLPPNEKYNDAWLGNLAYAWYPSDFESRMKYRYKDFYFLNPFMDRIFQPDRFYFYRTNRPYTDLYYCSSIKDFEQPIVRAIHTQNIDYYTNFGVIYQSYGSKEFVRQSNSSINSVKLWYSKEQHNYRYQINMFLNNVRLLDNGGIIDTGEIDQTYEQYYLTTAQTKVSMYGINANPEVILYQKKDSFKIALQDFMQAIRHYHSYLDENPDTKPELYPHIYRDSTYSYDSVSYDQLTNELRLKFLSHLLHGQISVGYERQNFYYFRGYIYRPKSLWYNNLYIRGGIEKLHLADGWEANARFKYYLNGRKARDFHSYYSISYLRPKMLYLIEGSYNSEVPSYFIVRYQGNTNRWNNMQFVNQNILHIKGGIYAINRHFSMEASYWSINHYINFSNAVPFQYGDTINVYQLKILKQNDWRFIHFDTWLNLQYTNRINILNLPYISIQTSLWLDFYLFKHAMRLNPGVDVYYISNIYQYFYVPPIEAFYINKEAMTGNIPIANIFLNIHVKRMSLFFKFDFVNKALMPIDYYSTVTHYHYPEFFYRFGARWWFKN